MGVQLSAGRHRPIHVRKARRGKPRKALQPDSHQVRSVSQTETLDLRLEGEARFLLLSSIDPKNADIIGIAMCMHTSMCKQHPRLISSEMGKALIISLAAEFHVCNNQSDGTASTENVAVQG